MSKNPIIINGLELVQKSSYNRKYSSFEKEYSRTFEESQTLVVNRIEEIVDKISDRKDFDIVEDLYLEFYITSKFIAKSYRIDSIFRKSDLFKVGSFSYEDHYDSEGKVEIVRGTKKNIENLKQIISNPEYKIQKEEIRRIDTLELAKPTVVITNDSKLNNVELTFYPVTDQVKEMLRKKVELILEISEEMYVYKWYKNNVLVINTKLENIEIKKLSAMNYLRSAYNYGFEEFSNSSSEFFSGEIKINNNNIGKPKVGFIDGGVAKGLDVFSGVQQLYEVETRESNLYTNHGSSVASVLLYGNLSQIDLNTDILEQEFDVVSVRGMPSSEDESFNLIDLGNIIEKAIPNYPEVRVWNLSVGPKGPISDYFVSSLTRILDELSFENDVIFTIAVGNTGAQEGIGKQLQIPSDSINNFAVTSFYFDSNQTKVVAPYASIGPGRMDSVLKPDLIDHGGLIPKDPILTFSNEKNLMMKTDGTSFAAPFAARKLAKFLHEHPGFTTTDTRALLLNYLALRWRDGSIFNEGVGYLDDSDSLSHSNSNDEIKIMYSGELSAKAYIDIAIPLPDSVDASKIEFTWTIVTKTSVNAEAPNEYSEYYIEDDFIPHSKKFKFINKDRNIQKIVNLSTEEGVELANELEEQGFEKPEFPIVESKKYLTESERKELLLKWNTTRSQKVTKNSTHVMNPLIRLHGLSRNDKLDRIQYCLVVNVRLANEVNLLQKIKEKYPMLLTIDDIKEEVHTNEEMDVQIMD